MRQKHLCADMLKLYSVSAKNARLSRKKFKIISGVHKGQGAANTVPCPVALGQFSSSISP